MTIVDFSLELYNKNKEKYKYFFPGFFDSSDILVVGICPNLPENGKFKDDMDTVINSDDVMFEYKIQLYKTPLGRYLRSIFGDINISFTNLIKHATKDYMQEDVVEYKKMLNEQIKILAPSLIVCLGNFVYTNVVDIVGNINCVRIHHHSFVFRQNLEQQQSMIDEYKKLITKNFAINVEEINEEFFISSRINKLKYIHRFRCFKPYFYVKEDEFLDSMVKKNIVSVETGHVSYKSDKLKKLVCKRKYDYGSELGLTTLRHRFSDTYEDDVPMSSRYIIDKNIKYTKNVRIMYIDIETNLSTDVINTPQPVISICIFDNILNKFYCWLWRDTLNVEIVDDDLSRTFVFNSEKDMLNHFLKSFESLSPDVIAGWFIKGFDLPYLINRMKLLNVNYKLLSPLKFVKIYVETESRQDTYIHIAGINIIDLKPVYERLTYDNRPQNYRLNTVAQHEVGMSKIDIGNISDTWISDYKLLIKYNIHDVMMCVEIDKKCHIIEYCLLVQSIIPMHLEDTVLNSRVIDMLILTKYKDSFVFPSKRKNEKVPFEGGWMKAVDTPGIYSNVAVFDFKSLYPSIYITCNISPDTIDKKGNKHVQIHDNIFCQDNKGFLPKLLESLIDERHKLEVKRDEYPRNSKEWIQLQNMQACFKSINNSIYGVMGYKNFRLFDIRIPSTITHVAREVMSFMDKYLTEKNYGVLYGDTDSFFVRLKSNITNVDASLKETEQLTTELNVIVDKYINDKYFGINKCTLTLECEKIFKKIMFLEAKKKYTGLLYYKKGKLINEQFTRGFEIIKNDMPEAIKPVLKHVFFMILNDSTMIDIKNYILSELSKVKMMPWIYVGCKKQISRNIADYKNPRSVQHINAVMWSNNYLKTNFRKSDFPYILYVKFKQFKFAYPQNNTIAIDNETTIPKIDNKFVFEPDYDMIFDKFLYSKIKMLEQIKDINVLEIYNKNVSLTKFMEE